jgi:hypothetical protein
MYTHPDWPQGPPSLLVLGLSWVKRPEHGADHPPHSSAGLKMGWNNTATFPLRLHTYVMEWPLSLPCKLVYYTDMGWMIRGSNPSKCKRFSFSIRHLYRLWDPPSLLFNGYRNYFTVVNGRGVKLSDVRHGSAIIVTDSSVMTEILLFWYKTFAPYRSYFFPVWTAMPAHDFKGCTTHPKRRLYR